MPNEFVVKNGLIVSGTSDIVGNLVIRQSTDISGSLAVGLNLDTGTNSVAIGRTTTSSGNFSHAEGIRTLASGEASHAEGINTTASGFYSHAEGFQTTAFGLGSHAAGLFTIASGTYQNVVGQYNSASSNPLWILGDGLGTSDRKNLVAAYRDNLTVSGTLNITGSLIATSIITPTHAEVHVSVSGSDTTGTGMVTAPYQTLVNAIASGSTRYGAGNYTVFVHPGTYAATTIPNSTPLNIMGVQESRGSDVILESLSMPSVFGNTRALALQNLKIDSLNITSGQVTIDGCTIGTLNDSANSSFGNFSGSFYNCDISTYEGNALRSNKYFRGCNISSAIMNHGINTFSDSVINGLYQASSANIQEHIFRDSLIICNSQVQMNGSAALSNTQIVDTTGSRQSLSTGVLRYSDSIFDIDNSFVESNLDSSLYGIVKAQQITGSLFADFRNLIYVSSGSGDDNNDGTYLRPKKTVAGALAIATSGTKIKIGPGIYREGAFLGTGNIALEGEYWNTTTNPSTGPQVYLSGALNISNGGYNEISNIKFNFSTGGSNAATVVTNNCISLSTFQLFNTGNTLHNNLRVLGTYSTAIGNTTQTINNSRFTTVRNTALPAANGRTTYAFNNCTFDSIPELIASGTSNFTNCLITSTNNTGSLHLNAPNSYTFSNTTLNNSNGTQARLAGSGQVTVDDFNFDASSSTHTNRTSILSAFDRVFAASFTGSLSGTASWATNVAGTVETASFVTNLNQDVTITGSLTVITGSIILSPESTITGSTINQPTLVQARNTSGQSISNNAVATVTNWTNIFTQNAAEWNPTTGVFTATKAGVYLVSTNLTYASVANTANGQQINVAIRKNTTDQVISMQLTSAATTSLRSTGAATGVVSLAVGDTVDIRAYHNLGNTATLSTQAALCSITIQQIASRIIH
jgi:hypothetical protein